MQPQRDVLLAPLTTFRLGGRARYFIEVSSDDELASALRWADEAFVNDIFVLGGGSNVVVADTPLSGLVIRINQKGMSLDDHGTRATLRACAGESWDEVVRFAVERDLSGLECLSGIPGSVGATPIQNVGAYGQEVSQTIAKVIVFDRRRRLRLAFGRSDCAFTYRDSRFKSIEPDRYIVLRVDFELTRGAPEPVCHPELLAQLAGHSAPTVHQIRQAVLAIRARKSMLADPHDPNARSAGSFFVNPIVPPSTATYIQSRRKHLKMPRWPMLDGNVKLGAAWLIEQSGFKHGQRFGNVGLSPYHCLVILAHEGAEASEVVAFARRIRQSVLAQFGVRLSPEPRFWGFDPLE